MIALVQWDDICINCILYQGIVYKTVIQPCHAFFTMTSEVCISKLFLDVVFSIHRLTWLHQGIAVLPFASFLLLLTLL